MTNVPANSQSKFDPEDDVFIRLTPKHPVDETKVRIHCACGKEYSPAQGKFCPACGDSKPSTMTTDGATWKTMAQLKLDGFREMLEPGALDEVPAEHREMIRKNIETQIRQMEDGSWRKESIRKLAYVPQHAEFRLHE